MPAPDAVLAAARQILEAAPADKILAACRARQPARAEDCAHERILARRSLLLEMREYVEGPGQAGCYAECAMRRHEVYKQPACFRACQDRVAAELSARLGDFLGRMRALSS